MKRSLISFIGALLFNTAAFAQTNMDSLARFHPLQIGNKWIFRTIRPFISGFQMADTIIVTREIIQDTVINGLPYLVVKETGGRFGGRYTERFDTMTGNYYSGANIYDSTLISTSHTYFSNSRMIYDGTYIDTVFGHPISARLIHSNSAGSHWSWKYAYGIGLVSYLWSDILPEGTESGTIIYARIEGVEHGSVLSVDKGADMPRSTTLQQNFPNPFNPSTTISFSIPSKTRVSLKIFDVMGREAATIVSDVLPAGNYSPRWDASGMPSGVYFYRLHAGGYMETKRLLLIR